MDRFAFLDDDPSALLRRATDLTSQREVLIEFPGGASRFPTLRTLVGTTWIAECEWVRVEGRSAFVHPAASEHGFDSAFDIAHALGGFLDGLAAAHERGVVHGAITSRSLVRTPYGGQLSFAGAIVEPRESASFETDVADALAMCRGLYGTTGYEWPRAAIGTDLNTLARAVRGEVIPPPLEVDPRPQGSAPWLLNAVRAGVVVLIAGSLVYARTSSSGARIVDRAEVAMNVMSPPVPTSPAFGSPNTFPPGPLRAVPDESPPFSAPRETTTTAVAPSATTELSQVGQSAAEAPSSTSATTPAVPSTTVAPATSTPTTSPTSSTTTTATTTASTTTRAPTTNPTTTRATTTSPTTTRVTTTTRASTTRVTTTTAPSTTKRKGRDD